MDPDDEPLSKVHLEQVIRSAGFRLIVDRGRLMTEQLLERLATCPVEDVKFLQGSLDGVRNMMRVPHIILDELTPKKR